MIDLFRAASLFRYSRHHLKLMGGIALAVVIQSGPAAAAATLASPSDWPNRREVKLGVTNDSDEADTTCQPLPPGQRQGIILSQVNEQGQFEYYQLQGQEVQVGPGQTLHSSDTLATSDPEFKAALDGLIEPYVGQVVTIADLRAIQDEVSRLYIEAGYLNSWADDVQLCENGQLIIQVTEGFIQDVNVGWVNDSGTVYVPAKDGPRDWQYAADYLTPLLRDDMGLPRRPVNLAALEERLQALASNPRFASLGMFSRLRVPTDSFLDNSIEAWQNYLNDRSQGSDLPFTPGEVQAFIETLRDIQREAKATAPAINFDTIAPGASVLEIKLQNIVAEVEEVEDAPFAINLVSRIIELENNRSEAFRSYFGRDFRRTLVDAELIRFALHSLEQQRPNIQAAVVYIAAEGDRVSIRAETAYAPPIEIQNIARFEQREPDREFSLNDGGQFIEEANREAESGNVLTNLFRGEAVNRDTLVVEAETFWRSVQNSDSNSYREYADRLYDLLIRPIENEFEAQGIEVNTLLVAMDADLGLLPLASLYDSEDDSYLAEKYRLAIIPNFRSLDVRPSNLSQTNVLAMGASEFRDSDLYAPLTAVPIELQLIENIWSRGQNQAVEVFRNEDFTLENLRQERRDRPYPIVHLASHANFRSGQPGDSSIQFWDTTLPLNDLQLSTLNFNQPPLELLVLSACQTALGDEDAVLGFAGSFLNAEVKSVLASLWYVNDLASLLYMMEFYRGLRLGLTKAEAVQNTQRALLDEQRTIQNLKELRLVVQSVLDDERSRETLTEAELERLNRLALEIQAPTQIATLAEELTHPFYWSAYTLVGNPW